MDYSKLIREHARSHIWYAVKCIEEQLGKDCWESPEFADQMKPFLWSKLYERVWNKQAWRGSEEFTYTEIDLDPRRWWGGLKEVSDGYFKAVADLIVAAYKKINASRPFFVALAPRYECTPPRKVSQRFLDCIEAAVTSAGFRFVSAQRIDESSMVPGTVYLSYESSLLDL